jgi:phosphoserine phosphatase
MDGTLLFGTTASLLLAGVLDTRAELHELETRFSAGGMSNLEFAQRLHDLWGVVPDAVVDEAFTTAPFLDNIQAVLADIHNRGECACLITMSPDYFAERCLAFGFDAIFASRFPRDTDTAMEADGAVLSFQDKPRLAHQFCTQHGCRIEDAVAYGDSASDVPLFETVGYRISVNGDAHLASVCDIEVSGTDLHTAYEHARRHIDQTAE